MKKLVTAIYLIMITLFIVSCGPSQAELEATETQISENIFATQTAGAPTATPIPGGIIKGRVYLMDRDEPVLTTVILERHEDYESVASTTTDEDGFYFFLVEEPDTYHIVISVMDLINTCDNLRTESDGWYATQLYDGAGLADIRATSLPMTITIGDEFTLDCELYCD